MRIITWLMVCGLLLSATVAAAADRLRWEPTTSWSDGSALSPADQKALRYRLYVGESPTTLVAVSPDVATTTVPLSAVPQLTPGRYVGVKAVLSAVESSAMSNIIRYAAPGEVLGLAIEAIP